MAGLDLRDVLASHASSSIAVTEPTQAALRAELARREAALEQLDRQRAEAQDRVEALRRTLDSAAAQAASPRPPTASPTAHAAQSARAGEAPPVPFAKGDKLRPFRQLFRGREDVFPRYWEYLAKG